MGTHPPLPFDLPRVTAAQRARATRLMHALEEAYPEAACALNYSNPHELLIATILSAQCTDAAVNKAAPALFKRFPTPADYAKASPEEIEPYIRSLGFFRVKAKAIHSTMSDIVTKHAGSVPQTMEDLLTLRGVARKTANVVLGNAFGINAGFVVDTHIERLARRFALVPDHATVPMIERYLMALFPRERWCDLSHMFIAHGRGPCKARGATCANDRICKTFGRNCDRRAES